MKRFELVLMAALFTASGAAVAQAHTDHHPAPAKATAASNGALAQGEIRKVDKEAGKITIKHGPLPSLDMPAMTMVFRARDPGMLEKVQVGDAIRFKAEKIDGVYTVTEYQAAK